MCSSPVDFGASLKGQFTCGQESDPAGEGSAVVYAVGEKVGRVDVIVDVDPVFAARPGSGSRRNAAATWGIWHVMELESILMAISHPPPREETDPKYFPVHVLIFDLVREGYVSGMRIDHPDGLLDPAEIL